MHYLATSCRKQSMILPEMSTVHLEKAELLIDLKNRILVKKHEKKLHLENMQERFFNVDMNEKFMASSETKPSGRGSEAP